MQEKLEVNKGIIYYTDNRLEDPLYSTVQEILKKTGLPISTASMEPITFGDSNTVVEGPWGYPTMIREIIAALEGSTADVVFFCEHDVLYDQSHFDFTPSQNDIFYYNENVWRWKVGDHKAIRYNRMIPLSCLCVNREFVLAHYRNRLDLMQKNGWDKTNSREPRWARRMGYEPGTKKKRRGGITDDDFETWSSALPNVDIRHPGTFSRPKTNKEEFKHLPTEWEQIPVEDIPGWDLKSLNL